MHGFFMQRSLYLKDDDEGENEITEAKRYVGRKLTVDSHSYPPLSPLSSSHFTVKKNSASLFGQIH